MSPISNFARTALACTVAALLGGCVIAGDVRPYPAMAPIQPIMPPQAEPTAGAIYAAGPTLQLYSDRRARDVGDLLTITLLENTTAQTSANTATNKESNLSLGTPSILGAPVTLGGKDILSATAKGARDFTGKGNSAQSNRLQGNVTVTVVQRLPNGNLVVQGQKNLRLNQGDELVQVQGIVRPGDIGADNTVPSSRVAEARIVYGGRGPVAQSNAMGWLSRFFNSGLTPF
ncbi:MULTISPECIES: flagellar basal body L-ring protein FlgH [Stenotrophomonas]|mgnify:FL=1|uniref:Flagellar L-ring protein n=1 Tax=Stenotrophomonas maltophilia TaxID=40324 RepID=A0A2J0T1J6_STEMA|nr:MULTISPECIES: flagellar basal body L-ring protein FlgH [Stenotrophomonas]MBA0310059.1 flagellar basal body L-ring protein FlgH [Stenotrophomonas maltophilia]MBH1412015.1 flagellar basal body L-ring protein FlgH [Stenotrophomonas maltophilia]MBH1863551.1 flagellar basal body L-ring protein FlgH [Stenotrophomonas maltophilia]MDH1387954.1 flagellar basal body L-ring protein FlgH [Stenotrophomonas sp. GD03701]MDH1391662.1 flagellar basal body L-ring protein FlgH [Stenotrophomonas sp. GD03702]